VCGGSRPDVMPSGLQVTAEVEAPTAAEFVALPSLQRLLVLDGIQDPGNLVRRQQLCVCCSKAVLAAPCL